MKKPFIIAALMALMLPLTAAAQQSLPISMDFENETAYSQWTVVNAVSSTERYNSASIAHDGSYLFRFHWTTNPSQYLVSPEFASAANVTQVSFWYMNGGNYVEKFSLGYSSTTADTTAFTWQDAVSVPASTPWTEYTSIVPAGTKYVAIRSMAYDAYYLYIDDIYIGDAPTCLRVNSFAATQATADEITLVWTDNVNSGATYTIYNMADNSVVASGISGNTYTVSGLTANTAYTFGIEANCSATDASAVMVGTFRTDCGETPIPFVTGFEDVNSNTLPFCWSHLTPVSTTNNYCAVQTSVNHEGSKSLRFNYSNAGGNVLVLPVFAEATNNLRMVFWHRAESATNASCGVLEVGYLTDGSDSSTFVPVDTLVQSDSYARAIVNFSDAPATARMAFRHRANTSNWYWNIDDLTVEMIPSCPDIVSFSVDSVTSSSAFLSWSDNGAGSYELFFVNATDTTPITSVTFDGVTAEVSDLTPNTPYVFALRAVCGAGDYSPIVLAEGRTECVFFTSADLPYSQNFDSLETGSNSLIPCWNKLSFYSSYPGHPTVTTYNGHKCLYFYPGHTNEPIFATLPAVDDLNGLMLSFSWLMANQATLQVGTMSNPADTTTFVPLLTIPAGNGTWNTPWTEVELSLADIDADVHYVAFRAGVNSSWGYGVYIDDVVLQEQPDCMRPNAVTVSDTAATSATLHIVDPVQAMNYVVVYGNDSITVADTVVNLENLTPATAYTVRVYTLCSDGNLTPNFVSASFNTPCVNIAVSSTEPYVESFETWGTGFNQCWNRLSFDAYSDYFYSTGSYLPIVSSTMAHTGSNSLRMYSYYYEDDYDYDYDEYSSYAFMPVFESPVANLQMSFWYKVPAGIGDVSLAVGVSSTTNDSSTFVRLTTIVPADTAWHQYEVDLSAYSGDGNRITFYQSYDGEEADYMYGYIDDITVASLGECVRPSAVSVSELSATTATITWVDINQIGLYRVVINGDETSAMNAYDTSIFLTNLEADSTYTVAVSTICDGTPTEARTITFHTPCLPVAHDALPWSENFDGVVSSSSAPLEVGCMSFIRKENSYGSRYPYANSSTRYGDSGNSLYFSPGNGEHQMAILPLFDDELTSLMFSAQVYRSTTSNALLLGVMTNPNDPATFVTVDTLLPDTTSSWSYVEHSFADFEGTGSYIAIRPMNYLNSYTSLFIDNISVGEATECQRVESVSVSAITATEVTLAWADSLQQGSYRVWLTSTADSNVFDEMVYDLTFTFTGLQPNTAYVAHVATICNGVATAPVDFGFTTPCDAVDMPWSENFDEWTSKSACWSFLSGAFNGGNGPATTYASAWTLNSSYGNHITLDGKALTMNVYGTNRFWAVTPTINISSPNAMLSADVAVAGWSNATPNYDANDTLAFAISTDGGSTFTTLSVLGSAELNALGSSYTTVEVPVSGYDGQAVRFAIFAGSIANGGDNRIVIDNVTVDEAPSCMRPSGVTVSNIADVSATVTISDSTLAGSYHMVIVSGADTVVDQTLTDTVYTVNTLLPNSDYTVMVSTLCDDNSESTVFSTGFHTLCEILTMPWSENFDSWSVRSDCWSFLSGAYNGGNGPAATSTTSWNLGNSYGNHITIDGKALYMNVYGTTSFWAVTPAVNITDNNAMLSADVAVAGWSSATPAYDANDTLAFAISTDGGATFTTLSVLDNNALNALGNAYTSIEVPVIGYNGQQVRFAIFAGSSASGGDNRIVVDNVAVGVLSSCMRPSSVSVSDVTDVSATVAISDSTQVGSYHLVIVSGTDTVVDQTLTDTTYTLSTLQPSTDYSVKVSAICSDGTETPAASASFRTLCGTMEMPWTESFDSWTVKSDCWSFLSGAYNGGNGTPTASTSAWNLNNSYGNDITISGKALTMNVYSTYRYWAVTPAVNITSDNAVLSVDVAVAAWSNATPNYDANDTLAFAISTDDGASFTNLMVLDSAALNALDTAYTSVEVPVTGYNGQQVRFAIFAGSTAAGGDNRIAIDNVSVTADTNAPQPEMYTVSATSADAAMGSATVSATRVAAGTSVTATATANNGYHFTNWTAAGTVVSTANPYTFTVSADIALTANFEANGTEPEECVDPTDVAASDITSTSATISWTAGGSETRWAIDWGTGADTTANNPYTLTGLEPNTTYYVKVKALCADGNESGWSSPATFTTATVGIDDVDAAAISLYPNPATTTVTISGIEGQATVTVVDMNGRVSGEWRVENGEITLDLTGYAQGAYFVRIVGEQQSAVRKLIVK